MKKSEAMKQFKQIWKDAIKNNPNLKKDIPAKREAFGIFIDGLCKDGRITKSQYETWDI